MAYVIDVSEIWDTSYNPPLASKIIKCVKFNGTKGVIDNSFCSSLHPRSPSTNLNCMENDQLF